MFEYYFNRRRTGCDGINRCLIDHAIVDKNFLFHHTHDTGHDVTTTNRLGAFYLLRDPVDAIYSYSRASGKKINRRRVENYCKRWRRMNDKWLLEKKARLIIRYEELIDNPLEVFKVVSLFFEVPYDEERAKKALAKTTKETFMLQGKPTSFHGGVQLTEEYAVRREEFRKTYGAQINVALRDVEAYKPYYDGRIIWND